MHTRIYGNLKPPHGLINALKIFSPTNDDCLYFTPLIHEVTRPKQWPIFVSCHVNSNSAIDYYFTRGGLKYASASISVEYLFVLKFVASLSKQLFLYQ